MDAHTTLVTPPFGWAPPDERRYLALFTDGPLTSGSPLSSIPAGSLANTAVFAIGFGTAADVDYATLATLVATGIALSTPQVFHGENAGVIDKFHSQAFAAAIGFTPSSTRRSSCSKASTRTSISRSRRRRKHCWLPRKAWTSKTAAGRTSSSARAGIGCTTTAACRRTRTGPAPAGTPSSGIRPPQQRTALAVCPAKQRRYVGLGRRLVDDRRWRTRVFDAMVMQEPGERFVRVLSASTGAGVSVRQRRRAPLERRPAAATPDEEPLSRSFRASSNWSRLARRF